MSMGHEQAVRGLGSYGRVGSLANGNNMKSTSGRHQRQRFQGDDDSTDPECPRFHESFKAEFNNTDDDDDDDDDDKGPGHR